MPTPQLKPTRSRLLFGAAVLAAAGAAFAQDYPSRPIRMIVPWTPGGGADIVARIVGAKLAAAWGQPVLIDNKPGATGAIGTDAVAKAAPDGYTLLMSNNSTYVMAVGMMKLPYDPDKDLTPISRITEVTHVLTVTNGFPATTLAGLIAQAKAKPGEISFASSGSGSTTHVAGELFMNVTGTNLLHVPYKGASPAIADTVAGNVQVSFDTVPAALPFVQAGKLRALAVMGSKRVPALPNVPTMAEAGASGSESITWYGLYGPGKLPEPIVRKLHAEMIKIAQMPEVRARLDGMGGIDTTQMSPEDFAASVRSDIARYMPVLKNIKKD